MNKKEKQQIKYLLENLKWYVEAPNEQDYNGEYEPPMEWEQGEAKIFLKYLEEKDKEIERLHSIIKEVREYIESFKKIYEGHYPYIDTRHLDLNKLLEILDKEVN